MAVVFISPKQRQKVFLLGIVVMFLLFVVVISFVIFFAQPKEVSPTLVFNKPKVNVDMKIFESDQFKNLQTFPEIQIQYAYTAIAPGNKTVTGFISADSTDQARSILGNMGLTVSTLTEVEIGRDNPFTPYYPTAVAPATGQKP